MHTKNCSSTFILQKKLQKKLVTLLSTNLFRCIALDEYRQVSALIRNLDMSKKLGHFKCKNYKMYSLKQPIFFKLSIFLIER